MGLGVVGGDLTPNGFVVARNKEEVVEPMVDSNALVELLSTTANTPRMRRPSGCDRGIASGGHRKSRRYVIPPCITTRWPMRLTSCLALVQSQCLFPLHVTGPLSEVDRKLPSRGSRMPLLLACPGLPASVDQEQIRFRQPHSPQDPDPLRPDGPWRRRNDSRSPRPHAFDARTRPR